MRDLYLLRGAPASGKSTFIEKNKLGAYTLSTDAIRLLYHSPELALSGKMGISQKSSGDVFKLLFDLLEKRMSFGETTFIDATNAKTKSINGFQKLAKKYRYQVHIIDFSNIDLKELLLRNSLREEFRRVPEDVITRMHLESQEKVPSWIKSIILPEHFNLEAKTIDLSEYKKIHHFGDIHGCWSVVAKYFEKYPFQDDEFYIFTGDYIDRGIENHQVIQNILSLSEKKNIFFMEGNHERHLWDWACGNNVVSNEFLENTQIQFEMYNLDKKQVRIFCRRLKEYVHYTFLDKTVLLTHAGVSIPLTLKELPYIATKTFTYGVGSYSDDIDTVFENNSFSIDNYFQVHGHRNDFGYNIKVNDASFNLEGKVEFGGDLRVLTLDKDGFTEIALPNEIYNTTFVDVRSELKETSLTHQLRANPMISEKPQGKGISSFNFKKECFFGSIWNKQTKKARGLFINTEINKIVARSYDKFFNLNERKETSLEELQKNLVFPLKCWQKENGYLGIVGYDPETDSLIIASKSTIHGPYALMFDEILTEKCNLIYLKKLAKERDISFVFEVVLPEKDPHIISYDKDQVYLLDIIKNKITFEREDILNIEEESKVIGCSCKKLGFTINNWLEFTDFLQKIDNVNIEGYVVEDSSGFMFKIKTPYYLFWKKVRSLRDSLIMSLDLKVGKRMDANLNEIYLWLKANPLLLKENIPCLRELFGHRN